MAELLGFCGIKCSDCDIYKAAGDPVFAESLAEAWKKNNPKAEAGWFKCRGCKGPEALCWSGDCKIAACARTKNINHCGECDDFKCDIIKSFENDGHEHHKKAVEYLESKTG